MTDIRKIPKKDTFAASDDVLVYSNTDNDARLIPYTNFVESIQTISNGAITEYAAPSSSGFSVSINDGSQNVWLILTPSGTLAAGTIVLPSSANVIDNQEVLVNTTATVTSLTVSGNGSSTGGEPTTLTANGFFKMKYNSTLKTWYRVG